MTSTQQGGTRRSFPGTARSTVTPGSVPAPSTSKQLQSVGPGYGLLHLCSCRTRNPASFSVPPIVFLPHAGPVFVVGSGLVASKEQGEVILRNDSRTRAALSLAACSCDDISRKARALTQRLGEGTLAAIELMSRLKPISRSRFKSPGVKKRNTPVGCFAAVLSGLNLSDRLVNTTRALEESVWTGGGREGGRRGGYFTCTHRISTLISPPAWCCEGCCCFPSPSFSVCVTRLGLFRLLCKRKRRGGLV